MSNRLFLLTALAAAAASTAHAQSFDNVDAIVVSDFIGRIEIKTAEGPANIAFEGDASEVSVSREDGAVVVKGPKSLKDFKLYDKINWRLHREDAFARFLDDYPVLTISLPAGADLTLDQVATIADGEDMTGDLEIRKGFVEAMFGDVDNADIYLAGSGEITLGEVKNALTAKIGGSGDIDVVSAATAELMIGGSGDISIGDIDGDTVAKVSGSGDIDAGDIGGALVASISGSGDIDVGDIAGGGEFSIAGSGDINARSVNGHATARVAGSGGIQIDDGRAEDLKVEIYGSGDFEFGGVSTNLDAHASGSGSVEVARNEGSLKTSGRGDFYVNGKHYSDRD